MAIPKYKDKEIVNQDWNALLDSSAPGKYLPVLVDLWSWIEAYTGHRWKSTSYIRDSPSHKWGYALDIAPDIALTSQSKYAVYKRSDPVLYKRERLIRQLQQLAAEIPPHSEYSLGIYIEPDHLHLHVMSADPVPEIRVFKFSVDKSIVYPDSAERMKLPLITI